MTRSKQLADDLDNLFAQLVIPSDFWPQCRAIVAALRADARVPSGEMTREIDKVIRTGMFAFESAGKLTSFQDRLSERTIAIKDTVRAVLQLLSQPASRPDRDTAGEALIEARRSEFLQEQIDARDAAVEELIEALAAANAKVAELTEALCAVERATNVPAHKKTDTDFLRASASIAHSFAAAAIEEK